MSVAFCTLSAVLEYYRPCTDVVEWRTPNQAFEDCHESDGPRCLAGASPGTSRTRVGAAGTTKTTLRDLEEDTLHYVRVTAVGSIGWLPAFVHLLRSHSGTRSPVPAGLAVGGTVERE